MQFILCLLFHTTAKEQKQINDVQVEALRSIRAAWMENCSCPQFGTLAKHFRQLHHQSKWLDMSRQTEIKEQIYVNKSTTSARPSSAHRSNLRTTSMRLGTCQVQRPGSRQWTSVRSQKETRRIKLTQTLGQGSRGLHLMPLPGVASGAGQTPPRPGTAPESSAAATNCKYTFFVHPRL